MKSRFELNFVKANERRPNTIHTKHERRRRLRILRQNSMNGIPTQPQIPAALRQTTRRWHGIRARLEKASEGETKPEYLLCIILFAVACAVCAISSSFHCRMQNQKYITIAIATWRYRNHPPLKIRENRFLEILIGWSLNYRLSDVVAQRLGCDRGRLLFGTHFLQYAIFPRHLH